MTLDLTDGHKRAIVHMYSTGTSIPDLAKWYRVDQATIREVLMPHVRLAEEPRRGGAERRTTAG
jgi:hypothetical protein